MCSSGVMTPFTASSHKLWLMLLRSPLLKVPHGFTTRKGGVSEGPFESLNLSASTGDAADNVAENQRRVLAEFANPPVVALHQVHGNEVHVVSGPGVWKGDGLLTQTKGLLLRVSVADCYPVLLHDAEKGVVGALHAGWRGVVAGILPKALGMMREQFGSRMKDVRLAVGQGISGAVFQVGPEVVEAMQGAGLSAFRTDPKFAGRFLADLEACLRTQALREGVLSEHYWAMGACTYQDRRFFSHRRDQGKTGRMWAVIKAD